MNKNKSPWPLATLLSLAMAPCIPDAAETQDNPQTEAADSELEVGLGYIANDAYHFGRYNGMVDQGPYIIGNVKAQDYDEDASFWKLRGTNLGLDSRYLRFDTGVQGSQRIFIEYDQLRDYENNTGSTPFLNPGDTHLRLPDGYSETDDPHLLPFDQEVERERLGIGTRLQIKSRWQLSADMSQETRRGTDWIGTAMGPTNPDNIFKWTNGALLPEPIDYETNKINAASLSWTDPLINPDKKSADKYRPGRISLEPDNQMHQVTAVLGNTLSPTTRVTALASASLLTQDDSFLPYSVSDTTDSLPQESLDGKVLLYRGQLKLTSQPQRRLRLSAAYHYDERDNRTSSNAYYYTLADGVLGDALGLSDPPTNPRYNDPLSYRKQKLDLSANYRFNSKLSLRGGYQYNLAHRDNIDDQVKTTRENKLTAKLKYKPISQLNLDLYGETGKRKGSIYRTRAYEHEDLRVSYLADLNRDKFGTRINFMPYARLSFGLSAEVLQDDYTESEIGLRESKQKSALFNTNYQITDSINAHAFYSYEQFESNNANENREPEKGTLDVWEADLKDRSNSIGLGLNIDGLVEKWDAGLDWVYTRSVGRIGMTGEQAEVDLDGNVISEFVPIDTQQFSDVKTNLSSLQLWARYRYSDSIAYKLSYWYEHYNVDDWAVDGTIENYYPLENYTIAQYLFLGEDSLDYTQHVVGVSVNVHF